MVASYYTKTVNARGLEKGIIANTFSRENMQEQGDISYHCKINIVLLVQSISTRNIGNFLKY